MTQTRDRGFSLIEVIVALGILSTAAISFSAFGQSSASAVRQLETRYLARTIADARLVDVFVDAQPIEIGVTTGTSQQLGREFDWVRRISPSSQDGLFLLNVQVSEVDQDTVIIDISTLKRGGP